MTIVGAIAYDKTKTAPFFLIENAHYLGLMLLTVAAAVAISLPVLLLPLAPAEAGVAANGMYYGVYCGVFATLWAITNWDRLDFLFRDEAVDWASFRHSGLLSRQVVQRQYYFALAIAWIGFSATFSLFGILWGSRMEESLVLFYGAPIAFSLVDCAWFVMVLPQTQRSLRTFVCVCTLNVLLCAPVLLLFVPSITGELLEDRVGTGSEAWLWLHDLR